MNNQNHFSHAKIRVIFILATLLVFLFNGLNVHARPLWTEESETLGLHIFEAGTFISERFDEFGSPKAKYKTANFPFYAKLGLLSNLDAGFELRYINHHLKTQQGIEYDGSSSAIISPQIKYSFSENLGLLGIWHLTSRENEGDPLPVATGGDVEVVGLLKIPLSCPININAGYIWKGDYGSKLGVPAGVTKTIKPGNIILTRVSLEIPLGWRIGLLSELAYYNFANEKIDGTTLSNSGGEAMDALGGVTWAYKSWNIGLGVAFGLLEEDFTSFDLTHGAGDFLYQFSISYKLVPLRPIES